MTDRSWWKITVSGYGHFVFYGDEKEAEEARRAKAQWEGGTGRKEPIGASNPMVIEEQEHTRKRVERGYGMEDNELESIGLPPNA